MSRPSDREPSDPGSPLDNLIAAYLAAEDAGQSPDRNALLAAHPDLAEELLAFFREHDRLNRLAGPIRAAAAEVTLPHPSPGESDPAPEGAGTRVRYFGDYELIEEIARGGMGVVYKARQTSLNRVVALKMILRGAFATAGDLSRFRIETEAVAQLDHPHIVPIFEVGEHDGLQYFTMKFIDGPPLGRLPRRSPREEATFLRDLAAAVHYAHQRGILHRDLKPSNVLIDAKGTPYVTDFGLAKRLTDPSHSITEAGQLVGTPRYMSPEQAEGRRDLTVAADVYALGALLYERLAGRPAFPGDDLLDLLDRVRHAVPPPLTPADGADRDLATIASRCLQKSPADRYPTADALADDLSRWLRHEPILARPVSAPERFRRWCRRNPALAGLTAAVAASLLLGTVASTTFALAARRKAGAERMARQQAEAAEYRAEGHLARGFLIPLEATETAHSWFGIHLSTPETEALWRLATIDHQSLGLRMLEEAVHDPILASHLVGRCEPALIAMLGLSPSKHAQASNLVLKLLSDRSLPITHRFEFALIGLALTDRPGPLGEACVATIAEARDSGWNNSERVVEGLVGRGALHSDSLTGVNAIVECIENIKYSSQLLLLYPVFEII